MAERDDRPDDEQLRGIGDEDDDIDASEEFDEQDEEDDDEEGTF
ncbi:MAG TPA: hypothetical protein VGL62_08350 [Vicinamibacterales bacterium]|jgi:hypothetical protein